MSESARTLAYAGVAVTSIIVAGVYGWVSQPDRVDGFDQVGSEFYEEFRDPSEADSLRVVAFDEETATTSEFAIKQDSPGQWVIPSHYDYPADARDRLNKTANSIIGIKRGGQTGKRESEHGELGVLDPLKEGSELKGHGQRITLKKGDEVLADYIIGKKIGDEGNKYNVRVPGEDQVYMAEVDVDLSTKFADWIEDDLLKIDVGDLREVIVNKYSIDETRGGIKDQELNVLSRDKSADPWTLDGLDEATEELKTSDITEMVNAIDSLKIVGVRPKPKGLNADLTVDTKFVRSQMQMNGLVGELQGKGFFILTGEGNKPKLYANEGNVMAATEDGLVYTLNFGELFGGSTQEIEIGGGDDKEKSDEPPSMENDNNRYLFVSVALDEKYLGEKPTKPAEPQKPEGLIEEEPVEKQQEAATPDEEDKKDGDDCGWYQDEQEEKSTEEKPANQKATETEPQEQKAAPAQEDAKKPAPPVADPVKQDAAATEEVKPDEPKPESAEDKQKRLSALWVKEQLTYANAMKAYEAELKAYDDKVAAGKKKVDDLNYRLGSWYYVISGESFKTLRLARTDLVQPKTETEAPKGPTMGLPSRGAPGVMPPMGLPGRGAAPVTPPAAKEVAPPVDVKDSGSPAPKKDPAPADSGQKVEDKKPEAPAKEAAEPEPKELPATDKPADAPPAKDPAGTEPETSGNSGNSGSEDPGGQPSA